MVNKKSRQEVRVKKHMRIRNRISGTAERPRLAVYRSNKHCRTWNMARKLKIMENEKHPLDDLKNNEITEKREK